MSITLYILLLYRVVEFYRFPRFCLMDTIL
nr:MAG TPA: hypothetical protein [Caudoviricetes sp.]